MKPYTGQLLGLALVLCWTIAAWGGVPVIYCTDLFHPHDDPDDHFDLATLFALSDLDIRAIILDQGAKQRLRPGSIPVSQMVCITGRQVPVAVGLSDKLEHPADQARSQPAEFQEGVALILTTLRRSPRPVSVVAAGSVRDVVAALNREPQLCRDRIER